MVKVRTWAMVNRLMSLYIKFNENEHNKTIEFAPEMFADIDHYGNVIGVEILRFDNFRGLYSFAKKNNLPDLKLITANAKKQDQDLRKLSLKGEGYTSTTVFLVYCLLWEETERGWGVRPDGYSLHRTKEDVKSFVDEYNAKLPAEVPDEYSRPSSDAYPCFIDRKQYMEIRGVGNGCRKYKNNAPQNLLSKDIEIYNKTRMRIS